MITAPKPGIYPDVPFETYLSWDAISNSSLHAAKRSMLHYRRQRPTEETSSMKLGTLCHAGKFEPIEIPKRYVVMPPFEETIRKKDGSEYDKPKATAAYREMVDDFVKTNSDKTVVTRYEYDAMCLMVQALAEHERANEFLGVDAHTKTECAIVWVDRETGLTCKGRVDALQTRRCLAGDLKTSADVDNFEKQIAYRSYHRQGAFYCDGLEQLTGDPHDFAIVAVENTMPYGVRAARLSDDAIEAGRDEYKSLLRQIAECRAADIWPGYTDPDEWKLPAWAQRSDESVELIIGGQSVSL